MSSTHWFSQRAALAAILATALAAPSCKKESPAASPKNDTPAPAPKTTDSGEPTGEAPTTGSADLKSAAGSYTIDPVHSAVMFEVGHMNVSKTLGRFNKVTGTMTLDPDPAKSEVQIEVDAASVFTGEKKRDDHLKSPDFFNVAQFPKITFKSTKIARGDEGALEVTGDLTLHGVTKPVTATFEQVGAGKSMMDKKTFLVGFLGDLTIKRSDFGMTNMIPVASDEVALTIAVEAARQ